MWNSAYIHMNPVEAKLASNPKDYEWSSYKDFWIKEILFLFPKI